jgi:hypothetical protein
MAEGLSSATATSWLDAIVNNTSYSNTNVWIQLHTAAPGAAGTTAIATNSTRKEASFGTASGGAITNDGTPPSWTSVPATETYTHFTAWSASTAGSFLFSGAVTNGAVNSGDDWSIAAADLDLSFPTTAIASGIVDELLDAMCGNGAWSSSVTTLYAQMHTADPGTAGTSNVATETDRMAVTFGAASAGAVTSDADGTITNVSTGEDYAYFSLWTASTSGTFLWRGLITANAVSAGNTFKIAAGDFDLSITIVS